MTVVLPNQYHATDALKKRKITCISSEEALRQDIRALRVGVLNIMPQAETYEFNIIYPLGRSVLQIKPIWLKLKTHEYKSSNKAHLDKLYQYFDDVVEKSQLDGLILTGAPVEEKKFEEVIYWEEVKEILAYARENIASTLGICWGGLALAKMLGIEKITYKKKLFGVYESCNLDRGHPITGELDDIYYCPQSRHAGISDEIMELERDAGNINLLAHNEEAGYFIFESTDGKYLAHLGHPEYNSRRIVEEALRDRNKGRSDVGPPINFDISNPKNRWRGHRNEFFTQWIKYVYDHTMY